MSSRDYCRREFKPRAWVFVLLMMVNCHSLAKVNYYLVKPGRNQTIPFILAVYPYDPLQEQGACAAPAERDQCKQTMTLNGLETQTLSETEVRKHNLPIVRVENIDVINTALKIKKVRSLLSYEGSFVCSLYGILTCCLSTETFEHGHVVAHPHQWEVIIPFSESLSSEEIIHQLQIRLESAKKIARLDYELIELDLIQHSARFQMTTYSSIDSWINELVLASLGDDITIVRIHNNDSSNSDRANLLENETPIDQQPGSSGASAW